MIRLIVAAVALSLSAAHAQSVAGRWIAEVSGPSLMEPAYAHVTLQASGETVSGTWGPNAVKGSLRGRELSVSVTGAQGEPAGSLTATVTGDEIEGDGTLAGLGRRAMAGRTPAPQPVHLRLTRALPLPAKPREIAYDHPSFQNYYSAANKPGLHIFPGDIVHTWSPDSGGVDKDGRRVTLGGDANIGPIYVEGALPGDTLVVHLIHIEPNRATARQGSRIQQFGVLPAYNLAARYDPHFNGEYTLDNSSGTARLTAPTPALRDLRLKMRPMLGCISVAPPGLEAFTGPHLGVYGGNLDYNGVVSGTTMLFPVFHPGALFGFGDGHAAMADGEVTQTGLEVSMDVTFSVDLIEGYQSAGVREIDDDYLISFGVAGSLDEALKTSTAQLGSWLKHDYSLSDSEVALLLGAVMKIEVTEVVDPEFDVVTKVPKSTLAMIAREVSAASPASAGHQP